MVVQWRSGYADMFEASETKLEALRCWYKYTVASGIWRARRLDPDGPGSVISSALSGGSVSASR